MSGIKKHWERFHTERDGGALTGSTFKDINDFFNLSSYIKKDAVVLNIGVGLGYATKYYSEAGCRVYALDISETALESVDQWTEEGFLHKNCDSLPTSMFDVAISHLVTQHMSEEDILFQFPNVIRSLKDTGILFVQFAGSDIMRENNISDTIVGNLDDGENGVVSMLGGRMVRTPDYAASLINRCGGKVIYTSQLRRFPVYKSYWYYLKVSKA